jgi:CubicO group peptidase (beta-lactamase class C family)
MTSSADGPTAVLEDAIASGQLPGGVLAVGTRAGAVRVAARGTRRDGGPATTPDTRYDLASLTKAVATLPCVVRLVSDGAVRLTDTVGRFVTSAGWFQTPSLADVTVAELLAHTSGLPNWRPFFALASDRLTAIAAVLQTPLGARGAVLYSDLGFLVLGHIVERVAGQRLDAFARRVVFEPLGMRDTGFGPLPAGVPVAATEDCGWRCRLLEGEVHDENAFRMDGVAGHAGLFGTAADLATYARAWLDLDPRLGAEAALVETQRLHADGGAVRRGLGWAKKSTDPWAGDRASAAGYGHTGFTGTSLWIEPEAGVFSVLLTNRVHPTRRRGERMHAVRRAFHDAVHLEMETRP